MELTTVWFILIAVLWTGYFVLEGFDFGVGVLLPFLAPRHDPHADTDRRVMINSIGPVWDGNEVWLLVAGGATFAAFPEWYASLFSGFYLPLLIILVALIVRGVAFEYRGKIDSARWRRNWDRAIFWGSALPALLWGVAFANIVRGVPLDAAHHFTGTLFTLLNPYALLGGLTTLGLFTLHGAVFLALKTRGAVRDRARRLITRGWLPVTAVAAAFLLITQADFGRFATSLTASVAALALVGAVVTDGTAVLGLGNVGPTAALPVMEGKAALLKRFGGLDAIPLVLATTDVDEIVETLVRLRPSFGAVSLEDVAAPRCFELEERLVAALDCPVMHDDQHGTAIAVLAALRGACTVLGRPIEAQRTVVSGAGAAGSACARILLAAGVRDVTVLDSRGVLFPGRDGMNPVKEALAADTNPRGLRGGPAEALLGADVFIGVSCSTVPEELIASMAPDSIVFALSNPRPEIHPETAACHAAIVGTGGSDFPNQIINTLASPGIYRGALDSGARNITEDMKLAAADAIAAVAADDLAVDRIVPHSLDRRVAPAVATAVATAARTRTTV